MAVVAVVLGKGLLEEWSPESLVKTHLGEGGGVRAIPPFPNGQEVVDNDSVRDTKRVEGDSIDALVSLLILDEDALDTAWLF